MGIEPNLSFFILVVMCGYFVGSIPFGFLITKLFSSNDIRKTGSGNIGATNVLRSSGPLLAVITLILDAGKGFIAVIIGTNIIGIYSIQEASQIGGLIAGAGSVLGHNFPLWLRFNGGKGVATTLGMMISSVPLVGFMACVIWICMAIIFRYSSVAALIALATSPIFALILGMKNPALMFLALAILGWVRHWSNINRLIKGDEPYIGK